MYFNDIARNWDTYRRIERAKILATKILENLEKKTNLVALEIGCGTGLISIELKENFKEIYCLDSSKEMIAVLKNKIDKSEINNIYILENDFRDNINLLNSFDIIFSSMIFHHILDLEEEFKKIYKLLKNDGTLIIMDLNEEDGSFHRSEKGFLGHNGFKQSYFKDLLKESGFKDINIKTIYKDKKEIEGKDIEYSLFLAKAKV